MADNESLARTPLFSAHQRAGGRMVPFAGWEMPVQYAGVSQEHKAVREQAGMFDVSHMGELVLTGEHALAVANYLVTNDLSKLDDGQSIYTCCCNAGGTILDDLIIYRVAHDRVLIVCNAGNHAKMAGVFAKAAENHCTFEDRSSQTALIVVAGPKAFSILPLVGDVAHVQRLSAFGFADARVLNVDVTLARTGYTGEEGVEIFCPWGEAEKIWNGLLEVGAPLGLSPCGLASRDTLRLECKMALYGNDIDETTNPFEAALGWTVKLDKGDFVGREALVAAKAAVSRKLVGFEMVGRGIARHGYALKGEEGGPVIGTVTSGSPSPTLGKNIGLGYVPNDKSAIGSRLFVDCRGKDVEAVVVKTPFYKRRS